ncbi:hypothetical protein C7271_16795 [filamentous cyanobacterium CCP5]|nr:hypothetical protein C7271_16795 [filamentous cyanobacterium CCP5]
MSFLEFFERISLLKIIKDHLATFKRYKSNRYLFSDIIIIFLFPIVISLLCTYGFGIAITTESASLLISIYSIFAGLLFGLQIFMFDVISRAATQDIPVKWKRTRIDKIEYVALNVSFEISVCLLGVFGLVILEFLGLSASKIAILLDIYLFSTFVLVLLSIIKGIHVLMTDAISNARE